MTPSDFNTHTCIKAMLFITLKFPNPSDLGTLNVTGLIYEAMFLDENEIRADFCSSTVNIKVRAQKHATPWETAND